MKILILPSLTVAAAVLVLCSCGRSAAAPALQSEVLTNGLRIVSIHFPESTDVNIFTFIPVGLVTDEGGQAQAAHLLEHLVVQSGSPQIEVNAETLQDHMRLDAYVSPENWQQGMAVHAGWLKQTRLNAGVLGAERENVLREVQFVERNGFTHKLAWAAWSQIARHKRKKAAVRGDVKEVTLEQLQAVRDNHFLQPGKVTLVVAGPVPAEEINQVATELFSDLELDGRPVPEQEIAPGDYEGSWDVSNSHVIVAWKIPAIGELEWVQLLTALQFLNMQLHQEASLKESAGAVLAGADFVTPEGTYAYLSAPVSSGAVPKDVALRLQGLVETAINNKQKWRVAPMLARQNEALWRQMPGRQQLQALSVQAPLGQLQQNMALQWGMNEHRAGANRRRMGEALSGVTAESAREAAAHYLVEERAVVVLIHARQEP